VYRVSYGECTPPPGSEQACQVPLTLTFWEPCSWFATFNAPEPDKLLVRGVEAGIGPDGGLRIDTADLTVFIEPRGASNAARLSNATRIANDLYGANEKAEHLTANSNFVAKPADACGEGVVIPPPPEASTSGVSMSVDADAETAGTQLTRTITSTANFTIALEATGAAAANGYQWELQWDDATLDFVSASENTSQTGATLCSPASRNKSAPAGKEWQGGGAGCLRSSGTLPDAVRLTTITLKCNFVNGATTELHLVTTDEDPSIGTTFIAPGGASLPTTRVGAQITCAAP
jgi:hypothetical protein